MSQHQALGEARTEGAPASSRRPPGSSPSLILIVGCQRSGTTLLGQLLGADRSALLVDEDEGAYDLLGTVIEEGGLNLERIAPILARADEKYKRPRTGPRGVPLASVAHLVLKVPNATTDFAAIQSITHPKSVIFAVRDVRDVVCSMSRLPYIPMLANQTSRLRGSPIVRERHAAALERLEDQRVSPDVRKAIVWRVKTSFYSDFAASPLSGFTVRYEDVVEDPAGQVPRLMRHVGMTARTPTYHPAEMMGIGPGLTFRERPVDLASAGRWKRVLPPEAEEEVWAEAESLMQALGYRREAGLTNTRREARAPDPTVLEEAVIATGRGGSGTRLLSEILQQLGVFLGNELNATQDSVEWADLLYEMSIKLLPFGSAARRQDLWRAELAARARNVLAAGRWDSPRRWGFKLPECMLVLPELAAAFPRGKFVILARHPVDSCLRRTHMTSRMDNPVGAATLTAAYQAIGRLRYPADDPDHVRNAISWRFQVQMARGISAAMGDRCLEIRYEDLCSRPQEIADQISTFLGLPTSPVKLSVDPHRMRTWSAGDPRVEEVWAICGEVAGWYGYSLPN